MLLNLSNHPSNTWSAEQTAAARIQFRHIEDIAFPHVLPDAGSDDIRQLAEKYYHLIREKDPTAVHVMGELTFCFALIPMLQRAGIPCYASTTVRDVTEDPELGKISVFRFVRFRQYVDTCNG